MLSTAIDSLIMAPPDEDQILVGRFLDGDLSAFDSLYRHYYSKVYSIARGILLNAEEANDAVQEIFTLVYRNLHRFDRRSRFSTWLFRIAINRSIQEGRKTKRHKHSDLLETTAAVEDGVGSQESSDRVSRAMGKLSTADRAVLTLFYWEDLSLIEIGESLNCGANAAKTRLHRARERFRMLYEQEAE